MVNTSVELHRLLLQEHMQPFGLRPRKWIRLKKNITTIAEKNPAVLRGVFAQEIKIEQVPAIEEVEDGMSEVFLQSRRYGASKERPPKPPRLRGAVPNVPARKYEKNYASSSSFNVPNGFLLQGAAEHNQIAFIAGLL